MTSSSFDSYSQKLAANVYGSQKGRIRLALLQKDVEDFCTGFGSDSLNILDVGCGGGEFAEVCLCAGHHVHLLDASAEMLHKAKSRLLASHDLSLNEFECADFLEWVPATKHRFDIVLLHGSAEWMGDAALAIEKACSMVKAGGYLSLLMFNKDVHLFKKGINGHLLGNDPNRKRKLFPPNALRGDEIRQHLERLHGRILLQSGIRIFQGFFRSTNREAEAFDFDHWLTQELQYYRESPFCWMGQHTHFIWKNVNESQ